MELIYCTIHFPPGVNNAIIHVDQMGKKLRYPISTYITAVMIIRVYFIFRLFSRFSVYRSTFADRCCAKVGIEADTGLSLKSSFKD